MPDTLIIARACWAIFVAGATIVSIIILTTHFFIDYNKSNSKQNLINKKTWCTDQVFHYFLFGL
ncbi:DUF3307 domain-containing protein [Spiroplasma sabaudiense]|uniref:DUF3307 domain-containing protein n=1 Tax=Spiroplasma sabaudiense TaxID=216944 RepID=UPI000A044362